MKHPVKIPVMARDLFTSTKAWIPRYISNETVLKVYDMLSWIPGVSLSVSEKNRRLNQRALKDENIFRAGHFIENQNAWGEVQFGSGRHHNMRYSGCEVIAVYNALLDLGQELSPEDMAELITVFEQRGAALKGEFGVAPHAIRDYLKNGGYDVTATSSTEAEDICKLGADSHTVIATVYNDKNNIMEEIHTVCITKRDGIFVVHNDYTKDGKRPGVYKERGGYATLGEAVDSIGRDAQSIYVIGIFKRSVRQKSTAPIPGRETDNKIYP